MAITILSGREFNQDIAKAKMAAEKGPIIVTDRGTPAFVLRKYDDWLTQGGLRPRVSLHDTLTTGDWRNARRTAPTTR